LHDAVCRHYVVLHGHRNLGAIVVGVIGGGVAAAAGKGRDKEGEQGHMPSYECEISIFFKIQINFKILILLSFYVFKLVI
jgi:hypothetical protein